MIRLIGFKRTAIYLLIAIATLSGAAIALVSVTRPKANFELLSDALDPIDEQDSHFTLVPSTSLVGRALRDGDAYEAGKALTGAAAALHTALVTQHVEYLEDYFAGPALSFATARIRETQNESERPAITMLAGAGTVDAFHLDGSSMSIDLQSVLNVRYGLAGTPKDMVYFHGADERYRVILVRKPAGWKISDLQRVSSTPVELDTPAIAQPWNGAPLKGLNYFPANHAWSRFWRDFDPAVITGDFSKMKTLGVNSIRIFLPFKDFNGSAPSRANLDKLEQLLDLAAAHGLMVVPTLFDMHAEYDPRDWAADLAYLRRVLEPLERHAAVSFIDLKNEPDLDYSRIGRERVNAWLKLMVALTRREFPLVRMTVGWSSMEAARELISILDIVSYHEYSEADPAENLERARVLAEGKPVFVTETGTSSWSPFDVGFPSSDKHQGDWLSKRLSGLSKSDGIFVWTLHDFTVENAAEVAQLPWRQRMQANFGLLDRKGIEKPAAHVFRHFTFPRPF